MAAAGTAVRARGVMGKKKSSVKPLARPKQPVVPKVFDCPFCFHGDCVVVKL